MLLLQVFCLALLFAAAFSSPLDTIDGEHDKICQLIPSYLHGIIGCVDDDKAYCSFVPPYLLGILDCDSVGDYYYVDYPIGDLPSQVPLPESPQPYYPWPSQEPYVPSSPQPPVDQLLSSLAHPQDKALERAGEQRHSGKSRDCGRGKCNTLAYEQQFAKKLIQQFVEEQRRTNKQRNCGRGKCGDEQQSADEQMVLADQQQSQAQTHAEVQAQLERLAGKQQFASEQRHTGKSRDCSGRGKCTAQEEAKEILEQLAEMMESN